MVSVKSPNLLFIVLVGLITLSKNSFAHSSQSFPNISVSVAGKVLTLEYANTPELREHGLAHKRVLCDDCGMLFDYGLVQIAQLSTQDIFLPIDIAFVQEGGEIVRIVQMLPFDSKKQSSEKSVRYAIEMNRGWFKRHKVSVGDMVVINQPRTQK
jgi:uncharacterized membrane protein (UPF0127 family)